MKSGESPTKQGPDVQKVPPVAAPAGLIWKLHTKRNERPCFAVLP